MTETQMPPSVTGPAPAGSAGGGSNPPEDEINLLELLYVLVKYKTIIIVFSALGLVGGYLAAKLKGPTYIADTVLVAKAAESARPNLGALSGLAGLAAGQFNLSGNPGLDNLKLYIDSRAFNAELIEKYDLLPDMFRLAPKRRTVKVYEQFYDTLNGQWLESEDFVLPTPVQMAEFLSKVYFNNEVDVKKGTLTVSVKSRDSLFSYKTLSGGIEHLDHYIKTDVQNDAKVNVDYLENQLVTIADPLLREKIQGMIASEIEKAMIVSREAFKVIDKPFCSKRHKEKLMYPIAGAFGMFLLVSAIAIFFHQIFGAGNSNPESRQWVDMIKKQLFKIF